MSETDHEAPVDVEEPIPYADEDPFAEWPQPESGAVIEDLPEEGESVQHVAGEIDVPDRYACVVALGAIVRGETPHFDYIASEAASGLQLAGIETGVPVSFGVLTVETVEQAEARIDKAAEAVLTALEMADVFAQLRASAAG